MNALKTLLFTVIVPGSVTIYFPYLILSSPSALPQLPIGMFRYIGLPLMLVGASIYFWCAWDFTFAGRGTPAPIDPPKELVVKGLYHYVRNPMYVGVLLVLLGEALFFASWRLLGYTGLVFLTFNIFVFLYEEPTLRQQFGESYRRYCASVPRWIPSCKKN